MNLSYRETRLDDLTHVLPLLSDGFLFSTSAHRSSLLTMWRVLLKTRTALSMLVEGIDDGGRTIPVGFGFAAFLTNEFAEDLQTAGPPYLGFRALEWHAAGRRPFLDLPGIAEQQALGSLKLGVLHYGWNGSAGAPFHELGAKIAESFFWAHAGYRIHEFFETVNGGPVDLAAHASNGLRVYREHQNDSSREWKHPFPATYLVGAQRGDLATANANLAVSRLFLAPQARFGFSTPEREALHQALAGETDQEMARSLGVSPVTIKKRWQRIYQKVDAVAPHLLAHAEAAVEAPKGSLGRRRDLLQHLHQHMEEVRPLYAPRRHARG